MSRTKLGLCLDIKNTTLATRLSNEKRIEPSSGKPINPVIFVNHSTDLPHLMLLNTLLSLGHYANLMDLIDWLRSLITAVYPKIWYERPDVKQQNNK